MSSKAQIMVKINKLTAEKSDYENQLNSYNKAVNYANKLINNLRSGDKYLDISNEKLKSCFTIRGKTADGNKIIDSKQDIAQIIRKIEMTVIPGINKQINTLKNKISSIDNEISILNAAYRAAIE